MPLYDVVEALVTERGALQVLHHLAPDCGWTAKTEETGPGERLVTLTRTKKFNTKLF